jgi:hypothetical protein
MGSAAGSGSNLPFLNRRASDPYNGMSAERVNPMLKLMEERMAAAAAAQKSNYDQDAPIQVGPVSSPVRLEAPAATPDQQAALQASINRWAGTDSQVHMGMGTRGPTIPSTSNLPTSRSFHKTLAMPSVCENTAFKSSFTSSQPLNYRQQEILQLLLLEQQQANSSQQQHQVVNTSSAQHEPSTCSTDHVPNNMAISLAEVDRLRQENQAVQFLQQQALQDRINEMLYLRQRSLAASALASSNISINTLQHQQQGSTDSLRNLMNFATSAGPYRKRNSANLDDDDTETICTSAGSHTGSHSNSLASHASFSSKARRTSFGNCTASMENLRIRDGYTNTASMSRLNHYPGGMNGMLNRNNSSFGNNLNGYADYTVKTGVRLNETVGLLDGSRRNSMPCDLNVTGAPGNNTIGAASSVGKVPSSKKSSFVHSLLSVQNEVKTSPKNSPTQSCSRPPSVGIDHNLSGQHHCSDKIIMSDLPDRIKYQNAQEEAKPMDIVTKALEVRGISSVSTKPVLDMPSDYFVQQCQDYNQEAVDAIRSNDIESLRRLHSNGVNLQCANKFGESLIHLACRRSHVSVVSYLVQEAKVSLRVRDDYGRTPFHDACWRGELDLDLIDMLLEKEPQLLMLTDKRGHGPLDYTRRGHWPELIPFLVERADKFRSV